MNYSIIDTGRKNIGLIYCAGALASYIGLTALYGVRYSRAYRRGEKILNSKQERKFTSEYDAIFAGFEADICDKTIMSITFPVFIPTVLVLTGLSIVIKHTGPDQTDQTINDANSD
jgi:hypothetical protein